LVVHADKLVDPLAGGRAPYSDQADRGTDLAGGAISALERGAIDEGALERMQGVTLGETLDRRDLRAILHDRQREARKHAAAVDEHRAGPALAVIAAFLGSRQVELVAQCVEQGGPRCDRQPALLAVHMQRDGLLGGNPELPVPTR